MIRYWFEFEISLDDDDAPYGIKKGCGVTAYNYDDALHLIKEKVFKEYLFPAIKNVKEDVDVSTLDDNHILLNMAPPNIRGIWFPLGYD